MPSPHPYRRHALLLSLLAIPVIYGLTAYEFVPSAWRFVERRHPALDQMGTRAFTVAGIPGDPLNLAVIGSEADINRMMVRAGWFPADPVTLKSSLHIAEASVLHKPYADAPVSPLLVNGQPQALSFEQADGRDPSRRHHVRFWHAPQRDLLKREFWMGAATFDKSVGLSHLTGQITHHIGPDVDKERDKLLADITRSSSVRIRWIDNFQHELSGKNGGGDPYFTDGRLAELDLLAATEATRPAQQAVPPQSAPQTPQ